MYVYLVSGGRRRKKERERKGDRLVDNFKRVGWVGLGCMVLIYYRRNYWFIISLK